MNDKEKARAYDEALNWMCAIYPTLSGADKEDAEHFFPDLRDSEDERIRTRLSEYFRGFLEGNEHYYEDGGYVRWEGLEIVRLLLLYDDRCGKSLTNRDNLFKYLRGMEGDGVITEEVLKRFYLKK